MIEIVTEAPRVIRSVGKRARLDGLQAGRAGAALAVAAFHANVYVLPYKIYEGERSLRVFDMGYAGVEYFFVLSGFIMLLVHRDDLNRPEKAGAFIWRRFVRVYPVYWVVLGVLALVAKFGLGLGSSALSNSGQFLKSALLLPTTGPLALEVSWTLTHEIIFYLVFSILILNFRIGLALASAWTIGCVAVMLGTKLFFPFDVVFSSYNFLFLFGMGAALVWRRFQRAGAWWILVGGIALFFAVGLSESVVGIEWLKPFRTLAYGLGATLMVIGLAAGAVRVHPTLSLLGDASYAIYLVHVPAMVVVAKVLTGADLEEDFPRIIVLIVLVACSAVAGLLLHLFVERPLLAQLRRLTSAS